MYVVLLDACVLVPYVLCDTLLRLAEHQLFRPLWSAQILGEVEDAIQRIHPEIPSAQIAARVRAMDIAFEDANVTAYQAFAAGLDLPDPDDRHVLAAAISGGAQSLVTRNLKDFPVEALAGHASKQSTPTGSCSTSSTSCPVRCSRPSTSRSPPCAVRPSTSRTSSTPSPPRPHQPSPTPSA